MLMLPFLLVLATTPQEPTEPPVRVHAPLLKEIEELKSRAGTPDGKGLFVRRKGAERLEFVPWESEDTADAVFRYVKFYRGGEVHFTPGRFPFRQGLDVRGIPGVRISGSPGTVLEIADRPEKTPLLTAPALPGDLYLTVDRPELMRAGWRYQLYSPDNDRTRVLEFEVHRVEGDRVYVYDRIAYMPMVDEIPAGSRVLEEVNLLRIRKCDGAVIEGLTFDGRGQGAVRGHTIYGGIYATGLYKSGERPTTSGLTVRGCTFRGLMGRGFCVYGWGDVRVEDCGFYDIHAQAIEIDHFSSAYVTANHIVGAESGIMLNDCFETLVEGNVMSDCLIGIRLLRIFPEEWVNTGNVVQDNRIGPNCNKGIAFEDNEGSGNTGNKVRGNHFVRIAESLRIHAAEGNTLKRNTSER
jgi:hypothetical protein